MQRQCDSCGNPYEAKRATSRYCGSTCRVRASRGALITPIREKRPPTGPAGLVESVRRELEEAERLESYAGQAAVDLATRIEGGGDTGSAVASLHRELRATMAEALAGARVARSPLERMRDDLAERRKARGA